jgi:hypothetical protein
MVKRVLGLKGPYVDKVLVIDDTTAAAGVTDGWLKDISALSNPFDSSGAVYGLPTGAMPQSYKDWLATLDNIPDPVLSTVAPTTATAAGGAVPLTCTGTGFTPSARVNFNGAFIATTYVSATSLTCTLPAGQSVGAKTIFVEDQGNVSGNKTFTYT